MRNEVLGLFAGRDTQNELLRLTERDRNNEDAADE